jgi:ferredoxin
MRAIVDRDTCIACELCVNTCPDFFTMVEGKSQGGEVPPGQEPCAEQAAMACPVSAIHLE